MTKPWLTLIGLLIVPVLCYALCSACGSGGGSSSPTDGAADQAAGGHVGTDSGVGDSGGAGGSGGGVDANVGRVDAVPFTTSCDQNPCDSEYTRCVPVYGGTGCAKACPGMPCSAGLESWCTRTGGFVCVTP